MHKSLRRDSWIVDEHINQGQLSPGSDPVTAEIVNMNSETDFYLYLQSTVNPFQGWLNIQRTTFFDKLREAVESFDFRWHGV